MRPLALLLLAPVIACSPEPVTPTVLANEAKVAARAAELTGWNRLLGSPATTIGAVNQYGFRATAYGGAGGVYASNGSEITLGGSAAARPNRAGFVATGQSADHFDRLTFTLAITDAASAEVAKTQFARTIESFMFSAKADGTDAIKAAIAAERPATGKLTGADYMLGVSPIAGSADGRKLTLTFARPGTVPPPMDHSPKHHSPQHHSS